VSLQNLISLLLFQTLFESVDSTGISRTFVLLHICLVHFFTITVCVFNEIQVCFLVIAGNCTSEYMPSELLLDLSLIDDDIF
jgi:hypothetical protein